MVTWKITALDRNTEDGFVTTAHWNCSDSETVNAGTEEETTYAGYLYGSVGFDGELTTPYADLTETQVIGWVKEALGTETVAATEAAVAAQIADQKAPTVLSGTPW